MTVNCFTQYKNEVSSGAGSKQRRHLLPESIVWFEFFECSLLRARNIDGFKAN